MHKNIKVIAFDADDTLWVNETYFREAELEFAKLLAPYETANTIDQELFKTEIRNLELYGYGIKGFILSMIETSIELTGGSVSGKEIQQVLDFGCEMLAAPIELLPHVHEVVEELSKNFNLLLITKGDLIDQEIKIE